MTWLSFLAYLWVSNWSVKLQLLLTEYTGGDLLNELIIKMKYNNDWNVAWEFFFFLIENNFIGENNSN